MKQKFIILTIAFLLSGILAAQVPQRFNYQAIVRDASGAILAEQAVGLLVAIQQGSAEGTTVYEEVFFPMTNEFGLINIQIGSGSVLQGSFEDIPWQSGPFYINIHLDPDGGSNYTEMGTTQLLSVPYALHAESSADAFSGEYHDLINLPNLDEMVQLSNPEQGDMLLYSTDGWIAISIGEEGQVLGVIDGVPQWVDMDDDSLTDIDGNTYETVVINELEWMAENLKVAHYNNGDQIPNITDNTEWAGLTTGAYCVYANNPDNIELYGNLYNWYAVDDERGLCPEGWRMPTDDEFLDLMNYLDPNGVINTNNAGGKMKATGNTGDGNGLWFPPNVATNESGFTALPGGARYPTQGVFGGLHEMGFFWTGTPTPSEVLQRAWNWYMSYNSTTLYRNNYSRVYGHSVRCVRD